MTTVETIEQTEWTVEITGRIKAPRKWCYDNRIKHERQAVAFGEPGQISTYGHRFTFFNKRDATLFKLFHADILWND